MFKRFGKTLAAVAGLLLAAGAAQAQTRIQGGGASFPAPLYAKWTAAFNATHPEYKVDYQGTGSGAGIKGITDRTLNFGASDAPLTADQEKATPAKLLHIPTVGGPEVMIYNLPGLNGQLKLNGDLIAGIYLGDIHNWDDAKIKALNPGIALPSNPIVVVHRSDGSGTTFIFTDYLSKVSSNWNDKVGHATSVEWPVGLGGKGNPGVADTVQKAAYSIGYVELAYAKTNKLTYAILINKAGKEVAPTIDGVLAAAADVNVPEDLKISITNSAAPDAYPICGFTYLLVYEDLSYLKDKAIAQGVADYISWCEGPGQESAKDLEYAKLPPQLASKIAGKLQSLKFNGEALVK